MSGSISGAPDPVQGYRVTDLVNMALRQIGVGAMGTTANHADLFDGVMQINMLLAQWQRKRWLVPNLVDRTCQADGQSVYYVGPGCDFNAPVRPAQIEAAYARLLPGGTYTVAGDFAAGDFPAVDYLVGRVVPAGGAYLGDFSPAFFSTDFDIGSDGLDQGLQPIDYPLTLIPSYEDYVNLGLKALSTWPSMAHYNPAYPAGELRPWPIPGAGRWELHILYHEPLAANLTIASVVNLPPEYWDAIMWTLAARLAPSYGQEASPTVVACAKAALSTIRNANVQVPTLGMPAVLTPLNNPFYWPGLERQRL
ncbi:hypothetical protein [Acidomonas methanolica]|uniref:Uncharacterized protein n=1 Tax=Acidomonas methanolica NBRC 104435 TaxID=1231351 RepID=A0A023D7I5_ACIMT|nr:hypothetical protein [Acidomonas methanolica]TCS24117.1 hypothetical protein EDC31_12538 [Acidomonas methanolica]GAJ29731.1 hypothetical protein Amme_076_024 [Acidomonas methanolica NBRC 104435]GBQ59450.1 hypothetical protein AA0498_2757 [Acidomonas methanolica]GEL00032.1 hypothetical protein AME01nite_25300 [Acidomonas methanolica NBRC 104435]